MYGHVLNQGHNLNHPCVSWELRFVITSNLAHKCHIATAIKCDKKTFNILVYICNKVLFRFYESKHWASTEVLAPSYGRVPIG